MLVFKWINYNVSLANLFHKKIFQKVNSKTYNITWKFYTYCILGQMLIWQYHTLMNNLGNTGKLNVDGFVVATYRWEKIFLGLGEASVKRKHSHLSCKPLNMYMKLSLDALSICANDGTFHYPEWNWLRYMRCIKFNPQPLKYSCYFIQRKRYSTAPLSTVSSSMALKNTGDIISSTAVKSVQIFMEPINNIVCFVRKQ